MASEAEIERMIVRILGDTTSYQQALQKAEKATQTFSQNAAKKLKDVGASMKRMGTNLSLKVTAPIVGMGAFAVKSFADFDQAMTESTSIMGNLSDQTKKDMANLAKELSTKGKQAPKELAESFFFLASAGLNAKQSMDALPVVQKFATAGAFDMALATDLLTDAQQAMGLASDDPIKNLENLTKVSDAFVTANTSANTSVQQISEALTADAGTAAVGFGQSLESTIAVLDAYASAGKKGAEAGNLYGRATRLLASAQMKNGEVFDKFGIKVVDEVSGEYRDMIDIIADMENAFKDMSGPEVKKALSDLGFEALAQKSITPLLGLSGKMDEYKQKVIAGGGATQDVADKQMKSFSNQLSMLRNKLTVVAIGIGEKLAPVVEKLSNFLQSAIDKWNSFNDSTQTAILWIAGIAAAIGPVLLAIGTMISLAGVAASAVTFLGGVLAALMSPITLIIAGVTALGAAVMWLLGFDLGSMWTTAIEAAKTFINTVFGFLMNFGENMGILWTFLKNNWQNLFLDLLRMVVLFVRNMSQNLGTAMTTLAKMFFKLGQVAWKALKNAVTGRGGRVNLGEELMKELNKGLMKIRNPLQGFQARTTDELKFNLNFERPEIAETGEELAGEIPNIAAPAIEAAKVQGQKIGKALNDGMNDGIEATESGSVAAVAKLASRVFNQVPGGQQVVRAAVPGGGAVPRVGRGPQVARAPVGAGGGRGSGSNASNEYLKRIAIATEKLVQFNQPPINNNPPLRGLGP